jgi:NAD(P)-dependent dehydrogenase (short-subunit alcohol dehydrogenase family)
MKQAVDRWVLITGCSTGIGRALVDACRSAGWGVVATARKPSALAGLIEAPDLKLLELDVTCPESIQAAVTACAELRLTALVNNAGYGQMGPLEALRTEELRAQFETNVLGLQAVTNAFLPLIRAQARPGEGLIVHVSSVLGRLSIPMAGAYNASKHAVVALGETLRMEVAPAIAVMIVEPGAIQTEFRKTLQQAWGDLPERVKGTRYEATVERYRTHREEFAGKHGLSAEACAAKIAWAMNASRPPRRLIVGSDSFWAQLAHRWLPAAVFDWAVRRIYGVR